MMPLIALYKWTTIEQLQAVCPYIAGYQRDNTCRCKPLCKKCGYGEHAAAHQVGHEYSPPTTDEGKQ